MAGLPPLSRSLTLPVEGAEQRLDAALDTIATVGDEAGKIFTCLMEESARLEAKAADSRAKMSSRLSAIDGALVSVKDLFDIKGMVTTAGSKARATKPMPLQDARVVQRLRQAGAVLVGRTNMTELAFSGIGMNPHFGTPGNPHDLTRVPGGSSSGAAVSVGLGMADFGLGTDTGGSTRIPPAFCGLVGFKPTQDRISREGVAPLSWTLDSVGSIAGSMAGIVAFDGVLADDARPFPSPPPATSLTLLRLDHVLGECDRDVAMRFDHTLHDLERTGVRVDGLKGSWLVDEVRQMNARGAIAAVEAFAAHRDIMGTPEQLDGNVAFRIAAGGKVGAPDYAEALRTRAQLILEAQAVFDRCDALVLPTVPMTAPTIAELEEPSAFRAANMRALSLTLLANALDLPSVSLPMPGDGMPAGLMLFGRRGEDRRLMAIATTLESQLVRA